MSDLESNTIRRMANLIIALAGFGFIVSTGIIGYQYIQVNKAGFEARVWPPTTDWTFRDWRQEEDGRYSAVVHFLKLRPECIYVSDQIVTVTYVTPLGEIGESLVEFVGDGSPGNSRPQGWQRLDNRMKFLSPDITPGTVLRANFLHRCHDGLPTISGFRGVVVGLDMAWPTYVQDWLANDRNGSPMDYR